MVSLSAILALAAAARSSEEPKIKGQAAIQRNRIASYEGKSLNEWIQTLSHRDADVRDSACHALGALGPDAKTAVPALIATLRDQDRYVRRSAAHAIGQIGPAVVSAVPALMKGLRDQEESVRRWAASSLGKIGPEAKPAVPALLQLLDDKEPDVLAYAAWALADIGKEPELVVAALAAALKTEKTPCRRFGAMASYAKRDVRRDIADSLSRFGRAAAHRNKVRTQ